MYSLILDEVAIDLMNKLEKPIKERIFKKILETKENPMHYFVRLSGRDDYKLRVGDYRIIADIENNTIKITFIGHRKNVYNKI
ncbi:type II toxin-antitoxin system RelE/ParE family toxin [Candidatus Woesearchaeota archaeon]|nr:MAG: RelE protein [archaeon GW2011_AR18]MBS3161630.1 type II toxin-antitoxin system RelE/ParE family toxin [Candidatus Woesearchaeota archaeon]HIH25153.1 type II toxin-antitoxin system RelE/ParE family toxin [Nanoarchaeota archaeon]